MTALLGLRYRRISRINGEPVGMRIFRFAVLQDRVSYFVFYQKNSTRRNFSLKFQFFLLNVNSVEASPVGLLLKRGGEKESGDFVTLQPRSK